MSRRRGMAPEDAEMEPYRYADGARMERGDVVWRPVAGGHAVYVVAGWDVSRALVICRRVSGGVERVPPEELSRWGG